MPRAQLYVMAGPVQGQGPGLLRPPTVEGMREAEPLPLPELSPDNYYHHVIGSCLAAPELSNQDYGQPPHTHWKLSLSETASSVL